MIRMVGRHRTPPSIRVKSWFKAKRKILFLGSLFFLLFLSIWQIIAMNYPSAFLRKANPIDVALMLVKLTLYGDTQGITLVDHTAASVVRVLAGFFVASISAVPLGILMGLREEIYQSSKSVIEPIRFVPPIAWIPLTILLLRGFSRYVFLIWLGAFFPILVSTMAGIKRTNPTLIELATTFGANKNQIVSKVVIPSSLPEIAAGMRIGLGVGWMCIMAAEFVGAEVTGIGKLIWDYGQLLQVDGIIAGMIVIGFVGLVMDWIIHTFEKRMFKWRREIRV